MPEIAEVETVRRTLKKRILNRKIIGVDIIYDGIIEGDVLEFKMNIINETINDINRIGKWLIFSLNDYYLLSHLRMEGKYFIKKSSEEIEKHEHIIFHLDDDSDLRYHDTRKFGKMILTKKEELYNVPEIKKQGYEIIDDNLTKEYVIEKLKNKSLPIKTCLLDQTIISGLGNIYADEVLFASSINPLKKGKDITLNEVDKIIKNGKEIITEAIKLGGTTIKSYTSSLGVTGMFQQKLKAHKREGEPCQKCGTKIIRIKVNGRSTYYCPNCQK